jgi:ubiquinone/menaquinone biosynthesis C-methylase UbiE
MKLVMSQPRWSREPQNKAAYTVEFDRFYTRAGRVYDGFVRRLPLWRRWLDSALPFLQGPRVLEVGFGTGYLLMRYAGQFEAYGVDYNATMVRLARANLRRTGHTAQLQRGSVEALPFPAHYFDTVLATMAFTGFPDGERAMGEMTRVLQENGRLVLVDVSLPPDGNLMGTAVARAFEAGGDILRDMPLLIGRLGYDVTVDEVGGFGSIQRLVALRSPDQARKGNTEPRASRP